MVGRHVVSVASAAGHETVVVSRSRGVDVLSGSGLDEALHGVDAVVDVSNVVATSRARAVRFFGTATQNLLAAGARAGVTHHVALSIVGIDRVPLGYYAGKLRQEEVLAAGPLPWTVLRATQFHEFPGQLIDRMPGPVVAVPRMRSATVAAHEVAAQLVSLAVAPARGRAPDLGGPEVREMRDLVRAVLRVRGRRRLVLPVRLPGRVGREMAGDGLLPGPDAVRGTQTFDDWLAGGLDRPAG